MSLNSLNFEQLLDCPVCFEQLDGTNRVLPCQHTFCKKCLETLKIRNKELRCPECRKEYKGYLSDLPCNITIIRILEQLKQTENKAQSSDVSHDTKNAASPGMKSNDVSRPANFASSSAIKICNYGAPPANFASNLASSVAQLEIHDRKKSNVRRDSARSGTRLANSGTSLANRPTQRSSNSELTTRRPPERNNHEVSVSSNRDPLDSGLRKLLKSRRVESGNALAASSSNLLDLDSFVSNQPSSSNSESSTQTNQEVRSSTFSPNAYTFSVELKSDKRANHSKRPPKNYLCTATSRTVDSTSQNVSPIIPIQQAVTRPFDPNSYTFSVELKPTNRNSTNQRRRRKKICIKSLAIS